MSNSTITCLIGIDAGASKTIGRLIDMGADRTHEARAGAASLTNDTNLACRTIHDLINDLLALAQIDSNRVCVVCGAAGAENQANLEQLKSYLADLNLGMLIIKTDAYISLMGATSGEPGVVVAIGTGSVAMRCESNGTITQFGGWGFRVGDQGSGAQLGRALVTAALLEFDKGNRKDNLISKTFDVIGHDRQQILAWVKEASARDFASLCPIIVTEIETSELARRLVQSTVDEIEALILLARGDTGLPVYITGGLGEHIYPKLPSAKNDWLALSKGDALAGALILGHRAIA